MWTSSSNSRILRQKGVLFNYGVSNVRENKRLLHTESRRFNDFLV